MDHSHGPGNEYGCNSACLILAILYSLAVGAILHFLS